jgi:predicted O-methyltransferase YrrM
MIEWGSGRSTTWFAERVGFLLSIESNAEWHARVSGWLAGGTRADVDYRFEPITTADRVPEPWPPGQASRYVMAVDGLADGSVDVALVDGELREACIAIVARKLKAGGLLVLDNSNWLSDAAWGITAATWELVGRWRYSETETAIWRRVGNGAR